MNSKEWRKAGYATLFRPGPSGPAVILVHKETGEARMMSVRQGAWMAFEWSEFVPAPESMKEDIQETRAVCYCDQGVGTCDFCSGVRARKVTSHFRPGRRWAS